MTWPPWNDTTYTESDWLGDQHDLHCDGDNYPDCPGCSPPQCDGCDREPVGTFLDPEGHEVQLCSECAAEMLGEDE